MVRGNWKGAREGKEWNESVMAYNYEMANKAADKPKAKAKSKPKKKMAAGGAVRGVGCAKRGYGRAMGRK